MDTNEVRPDRQRGRLIEFERADVITPMIEPPQPHPTQPIAKVPYSVQLRLEGITGTEGVEVIGANGTERIAVPTGTAEA